jgi:predicted MFS family arabinose efflux permease
MSPSTSSEAAANLRLGVSSVVRLGSRTGDMRLNEAAVFKWVVIVGVAAGAVIGVTLLTRPLVGALLGLALVIAGCIYAYRWISRRRHEAGSKELRL